MDLSLNSHREVIRDDYMDNNEKKEPEQLFQESWFYGNLLQTRKSKSKIMLRSLSDPTTSSSSRYRSYEETYKSIKKLNELDRPNLITKAPSMPSAVKGSDLSIRRNNSSSSSSSSSLLRVPSMPTSLDSEEEYDQDEEVEFSMGKLIRQASMKCSDSSSFSPKTDTRSSSISRQRSVRKHEPNPNVINTEEGSEDVIPQVPMKQLQPHKSLMNTLDSHELQGFKDLGFEFDELDIDPNYVESTISTPDIRERKSTEETNIKHSSYYMHRSAQPVPKWGVKRSSMSNELMKEQIKFWARAVAYNVRQEC